MPHFVLENVVHMNFAKSRRTFGIFGIFGTFAFGIFAFGTFGIIIMATRKVIQILHEEQCKTD